MLQMRRRRTTQSATELAGGLGLRRSVISSIIATVTRQGYRPVSALDSPRFAACACNETGAELLIEDSGKRRPCPLLRRDRLQGDDNDGTCNSRDPGRWEEG